MKQLSDNQIMEAAMNVKPGTIVRVGYRTELPVKAEFKKQGIQFFKYTEISIRLGVNYGHIASVIARKAEEQLQNSIRANNYEWIIHNKVRHNTKTGKQYLYAANFNNGANVHKLYVGMKDGVVFSIVPQDKEQFKLLNEDYLIASYWKNSDEAPEILNISFDNIYRIGSQGVTLDEIRAAYELA